MSDVWEMFRIVLDERKKREVDPTMRLLHECIIEADKDKTADEFTQKRLRELYKFFETTTAWYEQVRRWPTASARAPTTARCAGRMSSASRGAISMKAPTRRPQTRTRAARRARSWTMAGDASGKWLTYRVSARAAGRPLALRYLLAWPGMNAKAFLFRADRGGRPRPIGVGPPSPTLTA
jgi:hypothetical protein